MNGVTKIENMIKNKKSDQLNYLKSIDPTTNERFMNQFLFGLSILIQSIIYLYDLLTYPFYYYIQRPWETMTLINKKYAELENASDPYSAYVEVEQNKNISPITKHAKTLPEAVELFAKLNPMNFPSLAQRRILNVYSKNIDGKLMYKFVLSDYEWLTVEQVMQLIDNLAKGFISNGVKFQQRVVIYSETRMEWFLCANALFKIGAVVTTLFSTLGLKAISDSIAETKAEHIITTSDLLPQILKIIDQVDSIKTIYVIQVHPGLLKEKPIIEQDFNDKLEKTDRKIKIINYDDLIEEGGKNSEVDFTNNNLNYTRPSENDLAVILYTSGSTGDPKGVMLTHKNIIASIRANHSSLNPYVLNENDQQIYYCVLPLAHAYELSATMSFFVHGVQIGFGRTTTLTDNSTAILSGHKGDLSLLRPTIMSSVPLIFNRIKKAVDNRFAKKQAVKQFIYFCIDYKNYWNDNGFTTNLMDKIIIQRFKNIMGGRMQGIACGGAPLSPETHRFITALLDIKIYSGYGMTETVGAACLPSKYDRTVARIGWPMYGFRFRLADWPEGGYRVTDKPFPRGELLIAGEALFSGYYKRPELNEQSFEIDADGTKWFRTGDIVEVDHLNSFAIIDRKKDLIKLQHGEYVALGKIEALLKNFQYVENICVHGDSMHWFVIALISPARHELEKLAEKILSNSQQSTNTTFDQLCKDERIIKRILSELQHFCRNAGFCKYEIPQRIMLCPDEWTSDNNFLSATMKINRKFIVNHHREDIRRLYEDND